MSLSQVCSCRGHRPGPGPAEVVDSGLVTHGSLAQVFCLGGCFLVPVSGEVAGSGLLSWRSLALAGPTEVIGACSVEGPSLITALGEISGSGLFCGGHWLGPDPTEVTGLGLLLQRFLAWAWFHRGCFLKPVPVEVTDWTRSQRGFLLRPAPSEVILS